MPTQSQIRDALAVVESNISQIHKQGTQQDLEDSLPFWKTIRTILQSALDTQKPAGDAQTALDWLYEKATAGCTEFTDELPDNYNTVFCALNGDCGGGDKPAVFYCENGQSLEGLEQGALAVLSNLMMKTNATSAEFMIGNEKDGEFYFTCSRKPLTADNAKRGE